MSHAQSQSEASNVSEMSLLVFTYALYILTVTAPIGFVISAFKVYRFKQGLDGAAAAPSDESVLMASHHEWLVRTFIVMGVLIMASVGLAYYILGILIGGLAMIWWFYRLVRGAGALIAHHSLPATICTQNLCYGRAE